MSSEEHRVSRSAYVAVLSKDLPSPLAPESDEEKIGGKDKEKDKARQGRKTRTRRATSLPTIRMRTRTAKTIRIRTKTRTKRKEEPVVVKIDLEGIGQRILALADSREELRQHAFGKIGHPVSRRRLPMRCDRGGPAKPAADDPEI